MAVVAWDPALLTGDESIDEQHRRIFDLASALHAECTGTCDDRDRVADAVYALSDYVLEHFHEEEAFMERWSYPEIGPHRSQHAHLSGRVLTFTANYMNGDEPRPETLAEFVSAWLNTHILAEDLRMIGFARRHAAEADAAAAGDAE